MRMAWNGFSTGPVLPALLVGAVVVLAAIRFAPLHPRTEPVAYATTTAALPAGPIANVAIGASKGASAHHLRLVEGAKPHVHRRHDETVVVLSGHGRMTLGPDTVDVGRGSVLVVPRGTVHSLVVSGAPIEAVSVFSPPFDGRDRVFVDD